MIREQLRPMKIWYIFGVFDPILVVIFLSWTSFSHVFVDDVREI